MNPLHKLRPNSADGGRQRIHRGLWMTFVAFLLALSGAWYLEGTVPRHVTFASGTTSGINHIYAERYAKILQRDGIRLDERLTDGGAENLKLLLDPQSGVDVGIVPGGIYDEQKHTDVLMLATLYYQPLWIFYKSDKTLTEISDLRHLKIAIGSPDSSVRSFAAPLLAANDISDSNTTLMSSGQHDAVMELKQGNVDAILLLGPVKAPAVWEALNEPSFKLLSLASTEAYQRRYPYITKLTLPPGSVDFAKRIPAHEVHLIGTKAMMLAKEDLPFPLVQLLLDAARQIHAQQGFFEEPAEFPNAMPVDVPVSQDAVRHLRFGPKMLQRYMPLVAASYAERVFVLLVPLVVVLIPLVEFCLALWRAIFLRRIHRLYGELMVIERDIDVASGDTVPDRWLKDLDRIDSAAGSLNVPNSFANDVYALREHIRFVRKRILSSVKGS
jgi:TRAP-type uncharacterized transport system substrate-binding protein